MTPPTSLIEPPTVPVRAIAVTPEPSPPSTPTGMDVVGDAVSPQPNDRKALRRLDSADNSRMPQTPFQLRDSHNGQSDVIRYSEFKYEALKYVATQVKAIWCHYY